MRNRKTPLINVILLVLSSGNMFGSVTSKHSGIQLSFCYVFPLRSAARILVACIKDVAPHLVFNYTCVYLDLVLVLAAAVLTRRPRGEALFALPPW